MMWASAEPGSVVVTEQFGVEKYSHVMHMVSNVEAEIRKNFSAIDVFKATFPAGTVSGAPKIRAMEIIDEFEPVKRGIYGGAIGYLSWQGNMDMAIAIRTAVIRDDVLYIQAGGGWVADSVLILSGKSLLIKAEQYLRLLKWFRKSWKVNMLLMIDNYDSFTYNLVQYFYEMDQEVEVYRNDEITISRLQKSLPNTWSFLQVMYAKRRASVSLEEFSGKILQGLSWTSIYWFSLWSKYWLKRLCTASFQR